MSKGKKATRTIEEAVRAAENPSATVKAALEKAHGFREITREHERLARIMKSQFGFEDSLRNALRPIQLQSSAFEAATQDIFKAVQAREDAARLAMGPIEDMRRLATSPGFQAIVESHQEFARLGDRLEAQFRMPAFGEAARLATEIQNSLQAAARPLIAESAAITAAMASISTPWLDTVDTLRSAQSFASLQDIGATLAQQNSFADEVTASLRGYLGDWRDQINFSEEITGSISARSDLYESLGFDTGLTDFPNPAFEEALSRAGLREPLPEIEVIPSLLIPVPWEGDEPGFARTNRAHDHLMKFEAHVRKFIEEQMHAAFGDKWIWQRVPPEFRKRWKENQDKARDNGAEIFPLIEYADFTHYEIIIVRTDNWNDVFKPTFRRKESVRESWQRLYPIRLATMHARMISQDDELYLVAEVKRILKAIGVM